MKTIKRIAIAVAALALFTAYAFAQIDSPAAPPGSQVLNPAPGPAIGSGAVGAPTYVIPPAQGGHVINVGQLLGPFVQEIVDQLVNALIVALVGWVAYKFQKVTGISIDEKNRNALIAAVQRQAGSLIADGAVKVEGAQVQVKSAALAQAANEVLAVVPDAAQHFGITGDAIAARIIDMIPQIAAGAAMIASQKPTPANDPGPGSQSGGGAKA